MAPAESGRQEGAEEGEMSMRLRPVAFCAFVILICGCSGAGIVPGPQGQAPQSLPAQNKSTQYLYVYDTGSPGVYAGQYVRYGLQDLKAAETSVADGVGSPVAFGITGLPFFVDEAPQGG